MLLGVQCIDAQTNRLVVAKYCIIWVCALSSWLGLFY